MKDDLISRQAAMDLVNKYSVDCPEYMQEWVGKILDAFKEDVASYISGLPSAEPERKHGEWIPCSKHNPTKYGTYLVTLTEKAKAEEFGFDLDNVDVRKMRFGEYGWRYPRHIPEWINNAVQDKVIAWMPLPEPYKEEENDV